MLPERRAYLLNQSAIRATAQKKRPPDGKTVIGCTKVGNTVVNIKSVFVGTTTLCDILFEIIKENVTQPQE